MDEGETLEVVRCAAAKLAAARAELEAAVLEARRQGLSLRAVATAAGTNHEAVRTLERKAGDT